MKMGNINKFNVKTFIYDISFCFLMAGIGAIFFTAPFLAGNMDKPLYMVGLFATYFIARRVEFNDRERNYAGQASV